MYKNETSELKFLQLQRFCTELRGWKQFLTEIFKKVYLFGQLDTQLYKLS